MGFSFRIGERTIDRSDPECGEHVTAIDAEHPDAPPDPWGGHSNARSPSYGDWAAFAERVGLLDVFPHRETAGTLLPSHPGCAPLTREHLRLFATRRARRAEDHERLAWLVFWTRWALENCTDPVFANT